MSSDDPIQTIQDYKDAVEGQGHVLKPDSGEVQKAIDRLGDLEDAVERIPFWGRVVKQMVLNGHEDLARVLVRFGGPRPGTGDAEMVNLNEEA